MASSKMLLFVAVLSFALMWAEGTRYTVTIADLTGADVWTHCQDAYTDLGEHTLQDQTQMSWDFNQLIPGQVIFRCDFKSTFTNGTSVAAKWIPVWMRGIPCDDCKWHVDQTGFLLFISDTNTYELQHTWNPAAFNEE